MNPESANSGDGHGMEGVPSDRRLDIQRWYRPVYATCHARLSSPADAEDATQETFLRGLRQLDELRAHSAMGSWLRQIARHVCLDILRRQRVRRSVTCDVAILPASVDDGVDERDEQTHVRSLVRQLPIILREVVLLHYYRNMTYDEMAAWLGVARSTVNERLCQARQRLKQQLVTTEARRNGV